MCPYRIHVYVRFGLDLSDSESNPGSIFHLLLEQYLHLAEYTENSKYYTAEYWLYICFFTAYPVPILDIWGRKQTCALYK